MGREGGQAAWRKYGCQDKRNREQPVDPDLRSARVAAGAVLAIALSTVDVAELAKLHESEAYQCRACKSRRRYVVGIDVPGHDVTQEQGHNEDAIAREHEGRQEAVSYTHLRAHETRHDLVCRLLLEKKK